MRTACGILATLLVVAFWRLVLSSLAQEWYTNRIAECDKGHFTCEQFHAMAAVPSPWYVKLESKLRKRGV